MSLQSAISHAILLRAVLMEILGMKLASKILIESHIDSNNCFQAVNSTRFVEDKRLRLDIVHIQECIQDRNVSVYWLSIGRMLTDCLKKPDHIYRGFLSVLQTVPNENGNHFYLFKFIGLIIECGHNFYTKKMRPI